MRGISEAVSAALVLPIVLYAIFFAALLVYNQYLSSLTYSRITLSNVSCVYDRYYTYVNLSFVADGKYSLAGVEYALPGGTVTPLINYSCLPSSCKVVNGDFHLFLSIPKTWEGRLYIVLDFIGGERKIVTVNYCAGS